MTYRIRSDRATKLRHTPSPYRSKEFTLVWRTRLLDLMDDAVQEGVDLRNVALAVELFPDVVVPGQQSLVGKILKVRHLAGILVCATHLIHLFRCYVTSPSRYSRGISYHLLVNESIMSPSNSTIPASVAA